MERNAETVTDSKTLPEPYKGPSLHDLVVETQRRLTEFIAGPNGDMLNARLHLAHELAVLERVIAEQLRQRARHAELTAERWARTQQHEGQDPDRVMQAEWAVICGALRGSLQAFLGGGPL